MSWPASAFADDRAITNVSGKRDTSTIRSSVIASARLAALASPRAPSGRIAIECRPIRPASGPASARHVDLRSHRVLVLDDHPLLPVAKDIRVALDRLANQLSRAGARVSRTSNLLPDLAASARLHTRTVRNVVAFGSPPAFFQRKREELAALATDDTSLKAWRVRAPLLSHHDWMAAEIERARLRQQWAALFKEFDVVLLSALRGNGLCARPHRGFRASHHCHRR